MFGNLSFRSKLSLSFTLIVGIMAIIAIVNFFMLEKTSRQINHILYEVDPASDAIKNIQIALIARETRAIEKFAGGFSTAQRTKEEISEAEDIIKSNMEILKNGVALGMVNQNELAKIEDYLKKEDSLHKAIFESVSENDTAKTKKIIDEMNITIKANDVTISDMMKNLELARKNHLTSFEKTRKEETQTVLAYLAFTLAVSIALAILLAKSISENLLKLSNAATEISKGNFDKKIPVYSHDEIGNLATSFNKMAGALKKTYRDLKEKNESLEHFLKNMRRLEENLKFEHERMRSIFSSVSEAIVVIDNDYHLMLFNETAKNLLEINDNSIIGQDAKKIFDILKDNRGVTETQSPIDKAIHYGSEQLTLIEDNFSCVLPSGKRFPVVIAASPFRQNNIPVGVVIVFRDITSEKNLIEAKNSFIAISSHQLRTPLTGMRWFLEMLLNGDAGKLNKDQKHYVERVYRGTNRMINLVTLLLQIAHTEDGQVKTETVQVDLISVTEKIIFALKADIKLKNQKVKISANPKDALVVTINHDFLRQVIQNLLSNAIRYSQKGGVISVNIVKKENHIEYSVKDNGIGIPENQKEKVFQKFFRTDNALLFAPEGSGLGLSLVKSLVEGWGGKIWFESTLGKGSAFHFTIPLQPGKPFRLRVFDKFLS